ncbi:MAG: hypothetical protein ACLSDQ_06135 [Adlercreutzia equolifaciens]
MLIIGLSLLALRRSRALDTLYLGVIVLVLAGLTLFLPDAALGASLAICPADT